MSSDGTAPTLPLRPEREAPTAVGRYRIERQLGAGGMGEVYAAHDPELDRTVAVKLLRGAGEASLLRREAQVMAKLAHPNLLRVYDVGIADGRLFVAMELVDGETLGARLRRGAQPWREVLDHFLAAGRGLAAAHRAGVVHRDFKPDNVLVGRDGRVLVGDFGLAHAADRGDAPSGGTPAYMAPEQHLDRPADARADQFSFAVALYEGLYGARPFEPSAGLATVDAYALEVIHGRVREPARAGVPGWLWRIVRRALFVDPEARFPSMDALIAAIERRRARPRRIAVGAAFVAVAAAAAGGAAILARSPAAGPRCDVPADRAAIWDETARTRARAAFDASGHVLAADTFARIDPRLAELRGRWVTASGDACRAHARGAESADLLDRRAACLDGAWHELAALTDRFAGNVDRDTVEHAVAAVDAAGQALDRCSDLDALLRGPALPADPTARATIADLRARLAQAQVVGVLGDFARARDLATAVAEDAREVPYPPLVAEAQRDVGKAQDMLGDYAAAHESLLAAYEGAMAAGDDEIAASALVEDLWVLGVDLADAAGAAPLLRVAPAAASRASEPVRLDAKLYVANVLGTEGKYAEAVALIREVVAAETERDATSLRLGVALSDLGEELSYTGDLAAAREADQRALELFEAKLGDRHPRVAMVLVNVGVLATDLEDWQAASDALERALAIMQAVYPADHPMIAAVMSNLGHVRMATGRLDDARALLEQAVTVSEKAFGSEHPQVASALTELADLSRVQGRLDEAAALATRALAIKEKASGPDHPGVAFTLIALARIEAARGELRTARDHAMRALGIRERALAADDAMIADALAPLVELDLRERRWRDAAARADRAIAILEKSEGEDGAALAEPLLLAGIARLEQGQTGDAVAPLTRAAKLAGPALAPASRFWLAAARGDRADATAAFATLSAGDDLRALAAAWLRR